MSCRRNFHDRGCAVSGALVAILLVSISSTSHAISSRTLIAPTGAATSDFFGGLYFVRATAPSTGFRAERKVVVVE